MLDIDRLHEVLERWPGQRQAGKTTAMLVLAAHQADFQDDRPVVVYAGSTRQRDDLRHRFIRLAHEMGYGVFDHRTDRVVLYVREPGQHGKVLFTTYLFRPLQDAHIGVEHRAVYVDHAAQSWMPHCRCRCVPLEEES